MNGPEHFRRAEKVLARVDALAKKQDLSVQEGVYMVLAAQVHATLALAAATASPAVKDYCGDESHAAREWSEVAE